MHTFWQRVNAIFFYALSVLGFLALLCAGTTYFHTAHPDVQLGLDRASLCARVRAGARPRSRVLAHPHRARHPPAPPARAACGAGAKSSGPATSRRRSG